MERGKQLPQNRQTYEQGIRVLQQRQPVVYREQNQEEGQERKGRAQSQKLCIQLAKKMRKYFLAISKFEKNLKKYFKKL